MIRKIKIVVGVLLIVCLFLPLSTCTQQPLPSVRDQTEIVYKRYVVEAGTEDYWTYTLAIPFILPLLMALFSLVSRTEKLRLELTGMLCGLLILVVVAAHNYTGKLVLGGYLAAVLASLYLLLSLLVSSQIIRARYFARH